MTYTVGPGLLDAMTRHGTAPAMDSEFVPKKNSQIERCTALDGSEFVFLFATGQVYRRPADAVSGGPADEWRPTEISATSPNHGGPRGLTVGCVLHSTRGGAETPEKEFHGTLNWFANPASMVSAHVVIATDGTLAYVVDDKLVAWHAKDRNSNFLGAELVQPNYGDPITQAQYRTLGWWLRAMSERYGFPLTADRLPFHSDFDNQKSDIYRKDDPARAVFRSALAPYLKST